MAGDAMKRTLTQLGPLVLPLSEQIKARGPPRPSVTGLLDGLTFSMVGNSSNCQDKLRGAGSFAHLQNSIRTLCAARDFNSGSLPKVAVSYLLTPESVFEMAGAASWCRKNGVDAFVTVHLTQASCENQQKLQLMFLGKVPWRYRLLKAQTYLSAILGKMHLEYGQFRPTLTPVCDKNPLNCVFIRATGDVSPCVYLSPPVSEDVAWLYKGIEWRQKPLIFGNIKDTVAVVVPSGKNLHSTTSTMWY